MVRRQGLKDISDGKLLHILKSRRVMAQPTSRSRRRERIVRDCGEASKGPAGKGQYRKDRKCEVTDSPKQVDGRIQHRQQTEQKGGSNFLRPEILAETQ